jgi:hypothetical protein
MSDSTEKIYAFINAINKEAYRNLQERCKAFVPDFENPETFNVLTALLARQTTLMTEMASSPAILNGHSAPLFLRAMAEVHITFAWILLDPHVRAKQYIEHGLGQAVLIIERKKSQLESANKENKPKLEMVIEAEEAWVNIQKANFLVDVNVGAWSGENTRDMAIEAGLKEFYDEVYTVFSQCVHSTWHHVGKYNSLPSDSSLSRMIWEAFIADNSMKIMNLHLAAKYLDRTFDAFDEKVLKRPPSSEIRTWIYDEIQERFAKKDTPEDKTNE